jgi:hypothetical protein
VGIRTASRLTGVNCGTMGSEPSASALAAWELHRLMPENRDPALVKEELLKGFITSERSRMVPAAK